jgi:hypothetical protein
MNSDRRDPGPCSWWCSLMRWGGGSGGGSDHHAAAGRWRRRGSEHHAAAGRWRRRGSGHHAAARRWSGGDQVIMQRRGGAMQPGSCSMHSHAAPAAIPRWNPPARVGAIFRAVLLVALLAVAVEAVEAVGIRASCSGEAVACAIRWPVLLSGIRMRAAPSSPRPPAALLMSREVVSARALARVRGGRWQRLPLLISPPSSPNSSPSSSAPSSGAASTRRRGPDWSDRRPHESPFFPSPSGESSRAGRFYPLQACGIGRGVALPKLKVAGSNPVSRSILSRFACASWSKCGPRVVFG